MLAYNFLHAARVRHKTASKWEHFTHSFCCSFGSKAARFWHNALFPFSGTLTAPAQQAVPDLRGPQWVCSLPAGYSVVSMSSSGCHTGTEALCCGPPADPTSCTGGTHWLCTNITTYCTTYPNTMAQALQQSSDHHYHPLKNKVSKACQILEHHTNAIEKGLRVKCRSPKLLLDVIGSQPKHWSCSNIKEKIKDYWLHRGLTIFQVLLSSSFDPTK